MKVVVPAAGRGTRMAPISKVVPKELLLLGTKPMIQWVLEEAVDAYFHEFVIVISREKELIRQYLTVADREHQIGSEYFNSLNDLLSNISIEFIYQEEARGLGDAILKCRPCLNDAFVLKLPDNINFDGGSQIRNLVETFTLYGESCVAVKEPVVGERYTDGVFQLAPYSANAHRVKGVEPKKERFLTKGYFLGSGGAIFTTEFFEYLERSRPCKGEWDDVPALQQMAANNKLLAIISDAHVLHTGTPEQYSTAWNYWLSANETTNFQL